MWEKESVYGAGLRRYMDRKITTERESLYQSISMRYEWTGETYTCRRSSKTSKNVNQEQTNAGFDSRQEGEKKRWKKRLERLVLQAARCSSPRWAESVAKPVGNFPGGGFPVDDC